MVITKENILMVKDKDLADLFGLLRTRKAMYTKVTGKTTK